jgi:ergot alkaloid biosynthesis protein
MTSQILVTGATGKTGRRLVARLRQRQEPCRAASRASTGPGTIVFDWTERDTWKQALEQTTGIYLVAPTGAVDPASTMIDFIKTAMVAGASRFVLLSAALLPAGGPAMGTVHRWLHDNADDWTVLRPSWFMQNFSEGNHCISIRDEDTIYSAAGDGRVPFIDTDDVADVACAALTATEPFNTDIILTGPEALSYDDVARKIGRYISRPIAHTRLTFDQLTSRHEQQGLAQLHAQTLALMDLAIADGAENRITDGAERLTGHRPRTFDEFARANLHLWSRQAEAP